MKYLNKALIGIIIFIMLNLGLSIAGAEDNDFNFFTLFENHGAVMLLIEVESGAIIRANEAAVTFYGYPEDVLESMTIQQINTLNPEEVERERKAAAAEERNYFVFPHRLADGTIRTVEVYSYPFQVGDVTMLYSVIHDITEREENKLLLRQKLARLERAEQIAKLGYWELNMRLGMFTLSDEVQTILGLTEGELSSIRIQALILPEYQLMRDAALEGLILRNEPYDIRFRIRRADNGQIIHIHSFAEYNQEDDTVFGTIQDITQQIEQAAYISRQRDIIIYSMIAFIIILFIFIWFLGLNIRRRNIAENSLKTKLKLEKMLSLVSAGFVGSTESNLHLKFEEMVAIVGEGFNADRCYLTEFSSDGDSMTMTHEWCREGIEAHKQYYVNMPLMDFPWIVKQGLSGQFIYIPDSEELPEEASVEKEHFLTIGVKSILVIPILLFGRIIAHLGFDVSKVNRQWSNEEVTFLKLLTNILSDALEKCMIEKKLFNEKERLRITISSVGDGIIATDRHGIIELINPVAQNLTGWMEKEAVGKAFKEVFNIVNEYTRELAEDPVEKVLRTGNIVGLAKHTLLISKDGKEIAIADSAAPICDNSENIHGVVLVFRDVSIEQDNLKRIEYLSFHDQLTGLYNRHFFEAELKRLDTPRNLPISIVVADVNGLKLINDAFGHEAGDELLKKAAEVMLSQCRADEIVTRIGGDEFVILLPGTGLSDTERIVKRIQEKTRETFVDTVMLSISMGWACKDAPDIEFAEVFKQAEKYMYRRKLFESQSMRGTTVHSIIRALYEKNKREEQHSRRVSVLNIKIGQAMGLKEESIEELKNIGMLHDIGKIAIPDGILDKPGGLTPEERNEIMRHSEIGYHILSSVSEMAEIAGNVLAHHERWDGKGYPKGLCRDEIPLYARITAVANVYDSMVTERPYRNTFSKEEALEELKRNAGTQFDPEVVKFFVESVAPWEESEVL